MLHLAHDLNLSIFHCRRVQCDATAGGEGAIVIVDGHFSADAGESTYTCKDHVRTILDEPRHSQFLWVEACDVTLQGPLFPFCHCCLFWE